MIKDDIESSTNPYELRPHHGVCFGFFVGKGYSGAFTENMWAVKTELTKNPFIRITCSEDIVCKACPNNKNGSCISQEKVQQYDKQVLMFCGLSNGDILRYAEFEKLVYENIIQQHKRARICGNCQWSELCDSKGYQCVATLNSANVR